MRQKIKNEQKKSKENCIRNDKNVCHNVMSSWNCKKKKLSQFAYITNMELFKHTGPL